MSEGLSCDNIGGSDGRIAIFWEILMLWLFSLLEPKAHISLTERNFFFKNNEHYQVILSELYQT